MWTEIDHCQPPIHNSIDQTYVLCECIYRFLKGQQPEFESAGEQLFNRKHELDFENTVAQIQKEENRHGLGYEYFVRLYLHQMHKLAYITK